MKICMITSYPPDRCGISDYSYNLVRALRKINKKLDSFVISRKGGDGDFNEIHKKNVKRSLLQVFEELRTLPAALRDVDKCVKIIKNEKPDVVHVQYEPGLYNLFFLPSLLSRIRNHAKTVVTLHALDYFPLNIFHSMFLYREPSKIIVHTEYHRNRIRKMNKNTIKIPMGLNIKRITGKTKSYKAKNYILFFGFLSPHKGLENLLEAYKCIRHKIRIKLVIVGSVNPIYKQEVDYRDKIKNLIQILGLEKSVHFIYNYTPRKKLEKLITNSKFVVFPYLKTYSGGQSQAIIDAISFGKPIVISNLPGLVENISDNKNGLIVEPDNIQSLSSAILKLSKSPKLLAQISRNNKKLANELRWENVAAQTLNAYSSLGK